MLCEITEFRMQIQQNRVAVNLFKQVNEELCTCGAKPDATVSNLNMNSTLLCIHMISSIF